jgi:hypothetical protein
MRSRVALLLLVLGLTAVFLVPPAPLMASDHDDGETDTKGRNLNLTDLYAFRELDQNPNAGVAQGDLVLVMNTNPRSLARQQYYFSTQAAYDFHVTRIANVNDPATGKKDVTLRFRFTKPDNTGRQMIQMWLFADGKREFRFLTTANDFIRTTPINGAPVVNTVRIGGHTVSVFAGLREDTFFFDVEQFFRVRAGLLGIGPAVGFRNPGLDFAAGYNVNAIVVRVPMTLLQGKSSASVFDIWERILLNGTQVERLAQPGINEGLLVTNDFLNALNAIEPECEAKALNGIQPCAGAAAPVLAEAARTLAALGNSPARIGVIVGAFLPDVLRIDTSGPSGYATAVNATGRPVRGRRITDDVIDTTLTVLTNGAVTSDNVSYAGPNLGGTGHKPLLHTFPYLAAPN